MRNETLNRKQITEALHNIQSQLETNINIHDKSLNLQRDLIGTQGKLLEIINIQSSMLSYFDKTIKILVKINKVITFVLAFLLLYVFVWDPFNAIFQHYVIPWLFTAGGSIISLIIAQVVGTLISEKIKGTEK